MRIHKTYQRWMIVVSPTFLGGCDGGQSVLNPQSPQAYALAHLFWVFTIACSIIWILVISALAIAVFKRADNTSASREDSPGRMRLKSVIVGALVGVTAIILTFFTITSFYTTRGIAGASKRAMTIKVTGQQWWWEVEYENRDPTQTFTTANEIHIPIGVPVTLDLEAADVIHSFWVPSLMGKQDLIPGRKNTLVIQASRPGVYRGQCAQFCGLQHAHMAVFVFADPESEFETWRKHQLEDAVPPEDPVRARGLKTFLNSPCASCHTIEGTKAGGKLGPDLTHFGSRTTIGAGLLQNTQVNLWLWMADPQWLKPGCNMPQIMLAGPDFGALDAYLEGLK
jgi:cytochrome c oxidase subunit II